jgi:hypothetical protein
MYWSCPIFLPKNYLFLCHIWKSLESWEWLVKRNGLELMGFSVNYLELCGWCCVAHHHHPSQFLIVAFLVIRFEGLHAGGVEVVWLKQWVLWRRVMLSLNFQEIVEWMNDLPLIILVPWLVLVVAQSSVMESVLLYNSCSGYLKLQNLFRYLALSSNRTHAQATLGTFQNSQP